MLLDRGIDSIVFFDVETTGLDPQKDHITEVALKRCAVNGVGERIIDRYGSLVQLPQGVTIPDNIVELTGLTTEQVNQEGKPIKIIESEISKFFGDDTLVVAHNANFDLGFLRYTFGITPKHFICTKTIEAVAFPGNPNSLAKLHEYYYPNSEEQTHRAADDVEKLSDVFDAQVKEIGTTEMTFFINKIAILPERPLVYYPLLARYIDFTGKYVLKSKYDALELRAKDWEEDSDFLGCLEALGVENWSGYASAVKMYNGEEV